MSPSSLFEEKYISMVFERRRGVKRTTQDSARRDQLTRDGE